MTCHVVGPIVHKTGTLHEQISPGIRGFGCRPDTKYDGWDYSFVCRLERGWFWLSNFAGSFMRQPQLSLVALSGTGDQCNLPTPA